jgi:hypothetical protein
MSTQTPSKKPDGKPTIQQGNRDQNIGEREGTKSRPDEKPTGGKETDGKGTIDQDERGGNYGQREGSTISEDNDVE